MAPYVTIAAKRRQYMLMAEILRPSFVLFRRSTSLSPKKRQRLPEAVRVEVWQPHRRERLFEYGSDRAGVLAVQSCHFEPKAASHRDLLPWQWLRGGLAAFRLVVIGHWWPC